MSSTIMQRGSLVLATNHFRPTFRKTLIGFLRGFFLCKQFCFVGRGVRLGQNVRVAPFVSIEDDVKIGNDVFIGSFTVIRPYTEIGNNVDFGPHCNVAGHGVKIGDRVSITAYSLIAKGSIIESDVFIGPRFTSTNTNNISHGRSHSPPSTPPIIKAWARVGTRVTLLPGVTLGENSFIGSNSLVTQDVPGKELWYGSPAQKCRDL